jgi:uncharacterized coiled-coil protein SlyX
MYDIIDSLERQYLKTLNSLKETNYQKEQTIKSLNEFVAGNQRQIDELKIRLDTLAALRIHAFQPKEPYDFTETLRTLQQSFSSLKPLSLHSDLWPQDIGDPQYIPSMEYLSQIK